MRLTFLYTVAAKYVNYAAMLVLLFITIYYYGMAGRGIYAAGLAMVSVFGLFFGWSIGRLLVWLLDQSPFTPQPFFKRYNLFFLFTLLVGLILSLSVFCILTTLFPSSLGDIAQRYYWIFFLSLPYYLWFHNGSFFWSLINKLHIQNHIVIIFRCLSVIVPTLSCAFWHITLTWFLLWFCLINLLSVVIELITFIHITGINKRLRIPKLTTLWRNGTLLHLETISGFLVMSANVLIINYFFSKTQVGIYSTVVQLINAVVVIGQVGQVIMTRKITVLGKQQVWQQQKRWAWRCGGLSLLSCLLLSTFLWVLSQYAMIPAHYHLTRVVTLLLWLSPVAFVLSAQLLLTPQWIARNWIRQYFLITLSTGILNITCLIIFIKLFGFSGVTTSILIAFLWLFIGNFCLMKRTDHTVAYE